MEPVIVTVKDATTNDYGDILFHGQDGKQYKLGNKRVGEFGDLLQVGRAVRLSYATYQNKDYISKVEAMQDIVPNQQPPKPEHPNTVGTSIESQVAIKAITECLIGKIEIPPEIQVKYWKWLDSKI